MISPHKYRENRLEMMVVPHMMPLYPSQGAYFEAGIPPIYLLEHTLGDHYWMYIVCLLEQMCFLYVYTDWGII